MTSPASTMRHTGTASLSFAVILPDLYLPFIFYTGFLPVARSLHTTGGKYPALF